MKAFLYITLLIPFNLTAQPTNHSIKLNLKEVVEMAKKASTSALQAATLKENKYWQWRTFKSNYSPQLNLTGILPQYQKNNIAVTQPDGTVQFQPVINDNSQINIGIIQNIGLTGAQISLSSNLLRFRDFDRRQTRYNGNPLIIGITQPLFSYNQLAWDKKIEPIKYEESQKKYTEDIQEIAVTANTLFFNLLISQINLEIAAKNKSNNDTLFSIGKVRYDLGKISKDELLQLKLASLNAGKAIAQASLNFETAAIQLKSFIGFTADTPIELILPKDLAVLNIDTKIAISEARKNKSQTLTFKRSSTEADRDIVKAKGENGLNANLFATFGLTNRAANIGQIYSNPRDQQTFQVGFQIPVLDWGRSVSRIRTAQANKKLVEYTINQAQVDFDREIYVQVQQFNMIRKQIENDAAADQTAQERYEISKNRYLLGDITITDLNIALQEKDQSQRDYISSLKNFWDAYYKIRLFTLFDFEIGQKINN